MVCCVLPHGGEFCELLVGSEPARKTRSKALASVTFSQHQFLDLRRLRPASDKLHPSADWSLCARGGRLWLVVIVLNVPAKLVRKVDSERHLTVRYN